MSKSSEKKILILKNDRAGDLFTSLKLISSLSKDNIIKIYLSELNYGFSFFFKNSNVRKINLNPNLLDKMAILLDIVKSNYREIYILTPKKFYFVLPLIFRKIKFYAIVYNNYSKLRPNKFLRKFIFKFNIIYRDKINKHSYRNAQLNLLDDGTKIDNQFLNLNIPDLSIDKKKLLPKNFIFFQFRYKFFEILEWDFNQISEFLYLLNNKYEYVLFCSDKEININTRKYVDFFLKEFSSIDLNNLKTVNKNSKSIIYLNDLDSFDMFHITKLAKFNIGPHGIISHLSYFHKVPSLNLFNFEIFNKADFVHQKISFSEWYKDMNFNFSFLNKNFSKTKKKIMKNI